MLRYIEHKLELAGDIRSWSTLKRIMQTHCYATMELPTSDGRLTRIRKPGAPEVAHWEIYRQFGITSMAAPPRNESVAAPADCGGTTAGNVVTQKNGA